MADTTGGKGIFTSEFWLSLASVLSILIANVTGYTVDAETLNNIVTIVITYIGGRSAVKSLPQLIVAIVQASVAKKGYTNNLPPVAK